MRLIGVQRRLCDIRQQFTTSQGRMSSIYGVGEAVPSTQRYTADAGIPP